MNHLVDRQHFDYSEFALKFPTVEDIARESLNFGTGGLFGKI